MVKNLWTYSFTHLLPSTIIHIRFRAPPPLTPALVSTPTEPLKIHFNAIKAQGMPTAL